MRSTAGVGGCRCTPLLPRAPNPPLQLQRNVPAGPPLILSQWHLVLLLLLLLRRRKGVGVGWETLGQR